MTVQQVAVALRCSPRRVIRLIHSKQLPAIRTGNDAFYVNAADLDRWLRPPTRRDVRLH